MTVATETMCERCGERPRHARGLCGRCYLRAWRAQNPERARELNRAWKARHRDRTRAYDANYDAAHRDVCSVCGRSRPRGGSGDLCARCITDAVERRRARVVELWHDGLTVRELAAVFGWTQGYAGVEVVRMRRAGYDLPYRCERARPRAQR